MRILLIEDSRRLQRTLALGLQREGYHVDIASDGASGLELAREQDYDLLVLDLMLPELDGLTVLRRLRAAEAPCAVLILTARDSIEDRVTGLKLGADDYLTKPFALEELLARVAALLRRRYAQHSSELRIGELYVDLNTRLASYAEQALDLRPREFAVLEFLALRRNQLVSRSEIETRISADPLGPVSNVVDASVCLLRRRLRDLGCPELIETRRGMGYMLLDPDQ